MIGLLVNLYGLIGRIDFGSLCYFFSILEVTVTSLKVATL
ncbi:MAG: hypothetical protein TRG1_2862 [Flavobacteriaceae bacterium FS1-H7996/R]|nr:MAG: hypothetical protein TRG1_2862 [Flavobacteriaceae bacterium FS1-H7996/R]